MILVVAPPVVDPEVPAEVDPDAPPVVDTGVVASPLAWSWTAPWLARTWNLTDLDSPVRKLRGATGTGQAAPTHWWGEAPQIDGSSWEGYRVERGEVFLPLEVSGVDTADFLTQHDAFMRSLDPGQEGVLRVTRPDGTWREVRARYESGADFAIDIDPAAAHRAVYGITWSTADPYWTASETVLRFEAATGAAFFPGTPFTLDANQSLADSSVDNPGDVPSYPVWRVYAPFSGFSVGVGESLVESGLIKTAGYVDIDMNPRRLTILDEAGTDQWESVTEVSFEAIPPGHTTLTTSIQDPGGGSAVQLTFTPRYRRAW